MCINAPGLFDKYIEISTAQNRMPESATYRAYEAKK